MGRYPQPEGTKGSLKWIQLLVNDCPDLINAPLRKACSIPANVPITWVSPLRNDDFAEYRDQSFIDKLEIHLTQRSIKTFWPRFGPQWDALARSGRGEVFLVEVKAHITEMLSPGTGASPQSKMLINDSLHEVQSFLKVRPLIDWSQTLYQYANRLAHLYLLRELNNVPAFLVFVYVVGDKEIGGPSTEGKWRSVIQLARGILGLHEKDRLTPYIIDLFIDVNHIEATIKDSRQIV